MSARLLAVIKKANKARLDNRWGGSVGYAFHNFNPPSRFDAHPRPSGASAQTFATKMQLPE
jgi:hypothetical protein